MKAAIIGTICGISAAVAVLLFNHRSSAPPPRDIPLYDQGPSIAQATRYLPSPSPSSDPSTLTKILPSVNCQDMRLETFIAWLAESTGAKIYVEWNEMAGGAAAGPDTKINLNLQNVSAANALQRALDQSTGVGLPLGFATVDGIVKISIQKRLDHYAIARVYDVRDLIEQAVKIGGAAREAKKPPPQSDDRFAIPEFYSPKTRETQAADMLRSILFKSVDEDAWRDSREINYFAGRFVISQTAHNHELIAAMLAALRTKAP